MSTHPAVDALLGLGIGYLCAALHEFAHAVALIHYGRELRRAGFGFYWGSICFYIDSTEALTLPRRARVTQALIGLAVDIVTTSVLALVAHVSTSVLVVAVFWRLAIVGLLNIAIDSAPILEVDGHWALADYLDEPELAVRARAALGNTLRQTPRGNDPRWLVAYGGISLLGGLGLLIGAGFAWWAVVKDLAHSLFTGTIVDVIIGIYLIAPFALSLLLSSLGLVLEVLTHDTANTDVAD